MRVVKIGNASVSGLCIGGNPFSGFSHQGEARDREMKEYYTDEKIMQTLAEAERAGINTFCARTDKHIMGIIGEYRRRGGRIQWFAQIVQDKDDQNSWRRWMELAIGAGAAGAYVHGGIVDYWFANRMFESFHDALKIMRKGNVAAGFAGHSHLAHRWISENLDVDFQMCSYYNPTDRSKSPHHISAGEKWNEEDRRMMAETIAGISSPVIHYKVFAGGNMPIIPAFEFLGKTVRQKDVVLLGFHTGDNPDMIGEDVRLFEKYVDKI